MFMKSRPRELFSGEEAQWLLTRHCSKPQTGAKGVNNGFGNFVPSRSRDGMIETESIRKSLIQALNHRSSRFTIPELAEDLDVDKHVVEALIPSKGVSNGWFMKQDGFIVPRPAYKALLKRLFEELSHQPVYFDSFCEREELSHADFAALLHASNELLRLHGPPQDRSLRAESSKVCPGYILSFKYRDDLRKALISSLGSAQSPVQLQELGLPGEPPSKLVCSEALDLIATGSITGLVSPEDDLVFTPAVLVTQRQEEVVQRLSSGELAWISRLDLLSDYGIDLKVQDNVSVRIRELTTSIEDVVVSLDYRERKLSKLKSDVKSGGSAYIECAGLPELKTHLFDELRSREDSQLELIQDTVINGALRSSLESRIGELARDQARAHWQERNHGVYQRETALQSMVSDHPELSPSTLRLILRNNTKAPDEVLYQAEVDRLLLEEDKTIYATWNDSVISKYYLYCAGLDSIQPAKLREELALSLCDYLIRDLIPSVLSRVPAESLRRNKELSKAVKAQKRGIEDLNTSQESKKGALSDLRKVISTFPLSKKPDVDATKAGHVNEMLSNMKTDENQPRLFLTLVLVLMAKHQPGVIYASGRFAPRLLKHLKSKYDEKTTQWLETIKDKAKSNELTPQTRDDVYKFATKEWEDRQPITD